MDVVMLALARKAAKPVEIVLNDYGIDLTTLISKGGGVASYNVPQTFWDTADMDKEIVLVSTNLVGYDSRSAPVHKIFSRGTKQVVSISAGIALQTSSGFMDIKIAINKGVVSGSLGAWVYVVVTPLTIPTT